MKLELQLAVRLEILRNLDDEEETLSTVSFVTLRLSPWRSWLVLIMMILVKG
jgi:hypothetical protein